MLTVLIRSTLLFIVAVFVMRMMGKRQVSQLQPYELVIAIMIADLASTPMGDIGVPLLYGILPMLTLMMLHSAISLGNMKSQRFRALICGTPSILIRKGVVQEAELKRMCMDLSDLLEELRASGVLSPADVGTAILETSGKMSVFPNADKRPLTPEDMGVAVQYEGIPLTLVMDGEVQYQNLTVGGLDLNWLNNALGDAGFRSHDEILLASLDTRGMLFAQGRGNKPRLAIRQALEPEKVAW